jgi:hypothetical protein
MPTTEPFMTPSAMGALEQLRGMGGGGVQEAAGLRDVVSLIEASRSRRPRVDGWEAVARVGADKALKALYHAADSYFSAVLAEIAAQRRDAESSARSAAQEVIQRRQAVALSVRKDHRAGVTYHAPELVVISCSCSRFMAHKMDRTDAERLFVEHLEAVSQQ